MLGFDCVLVKLSMSSQPDRTLTLMADFGCMNTSSSCSDLACNLEFLARSHSSSIDLKIWIFLFIGYLQGQLSGSLSRKLEALTN